MKNKKAHPLADAQATRLDILYGGTESAVMRETMKIATDSIGTLEFEEHIFVINTLMNKRDFEPIFMAQMDKRESLRAANFFGSKLIQKLPLFEHMITMMKVRLVILTNYDLAVYNSRHRMQLLEFIKWMRDDQNIHVIICMNKLPTTWGSQGSLRMMASSIEAVGGHEESESQETFGVSAATMDNAMYPLKREEFKPTAEKGMRSTVAARVDEEDPREIICTDRELDLAEYKVQESDVPKEYTPFSDPEKYSNAARAALRNKELAVENV